MINITGIWLMVVSKQLFKRLGVCAAWTGRRTYILTQTKSSRHVATIQDLSD